MLTAVQLNNEYQEISLWANSGSTASFSEQDVTLSDDFSKYEYLLFECSFTSSTKSIKTLVPVKSILSVNAANASFSPIGNIAYSSSIVLARNAKWVNTYAKNKLTISNCSQIGGTTVVNSSLVPLTIKGLKKNPLLSLIENSNLDKQVSKVELWKNNSVTAPFVKQSIIVDNFSEYDYLEVVYKLSNSSSQELTYNCLVSVEDFKKKTTSGSIAYMPSGSLGYHYDSGSSVGSYYRCFYYESDTKIAISSSRNFNDSNVIADDMNIPVLVNGLKIKVTAGTDIEEPELLWRNPSTTTAFALQTVTLNKPRSTFDYLIMTFKESTTLNSVYTCIIDTKLIPYGALAYAQVGYYTIAGNWARRSVGGTSSTLNTQLSIDSCAYDTSTTAHAYDNTRMIPIAIYGTNNFTQGVPTSSKNYIFKDGKFTVTPTTNTGTISGGNLVMTQASVLQIPFTDTTQRIFVRYYYTAKGNYFHTVYLDNGKGNTAIYGSVTYLIDTYATNVPMIRGLDAYTMIKLSNGYNGATYTAVITDIWTETA